MMRAPADASASYAAEVARLLWPEPWGAPRVTRSRRPGATDRDAYVFPSPRRPRLLVPADLPASATMLGRLGSDRSPYAGMLRTVLQRAVRSRAVSLVRWPVLRVPGTDPVGDSVERHLAEALGTEVRVGVILGTRRANQKPVLQVFGLDGPLLGYAKVGHNDLTAALVRREAAALATIGGLRPESFRVPRVLHAGRWAGLEILVQSPLETDAGVPVPARVRLAATEEVARLAGTVGAPLADSSFWCRLRAEADAVAGARDGDRLRVAVEAVASRHGADQVDLGGWHGDWGHWNMGMGQGVLQVWDWERYDARVPLGFDALHYAAQGVRPGAKEAPRAEAAFLDSVPRLLGEQGVPDDRHELTLRLYLLEIAARYVEALTHGETPALLRRTEWVLSLLEQRLDHIHPDPIPSKGRP